MRVVGDVQIDWDDVDNIYDQRAAIVLCEVKATNRDNVGPDFGGHFFSLSTAELLVAQKLGSSFEFVFVHVGKHLGAVLALTLQEVYGRAQAIYPTWSIRLAPTKEV